VPHALAAYVTYACAKGHGFWHGLQGGQPGEPGQGFGGFGHGRKLGSGDLQLLILALLAEQARHGYDLIKEIEQRSKGYYVPSPGMVYPALSYLEDAGYASVEAEGSKKLYTISVAGMAFLDEQRAAVDALWQQLAWLGERMDRMRQAFEGEGSDSELHAAMHALRDALRERGRGASAEERKRLLDILARAAAEVRRR